MTKESINELGCFEKLNRDGLLSLSSEVIQDIYDRVKVQRFREREGDNIKLKYLRVLVAAIQTHNTVLRDEELEDVKTRLELLEAACEGNR